MIRRYIWAVTLSVVTAIAFAQGVPVTAGRQAVASPPQTAGMTTGQSTTLLPDGRILRLGGSGPDGPTWTVAIYDPSTQTTITLPGRMLEARAGHTATILPDGGVLIVGGRGATGEPLASAERFDPATETFAPVAMPNALPRTGHTATLLTDGSVLLVGGQTTGKVPAIAAELWNVDSHSLTPVADVFARAGQAATLLGDGRVLLTGGTDATGRPAATEIFTPGMNRFALVPPGEVRAPEAGALSVTQITPTPDAIDVPVDSRITLRLSHAARPGTITDQTVALSGPDGPVTTRVVAAEDGRLVFVWPAVPFTGDATYTLTVSGLVDAGGTSVTPALFRFTTVAPDPNSVVDAEDWIPDATSVQTGWRLNRPPSPWESLAPLQAPGGATAISGRVLTLDGRPLPGVTLGVEDDAHTESDRTGRFLLVLQHAPPGRRVLQIEGKSANRGRKHYGFFEYGSPIPAGKTTVLPFTIWMPKLDLRHVVTIPSSTTREVVVTTPYIPGLELHLPPQTTLTGEDGQPVTQVGLTPIPVDRPPFPLAKNVDVPVYFTAQPGGTYIHTGGPGPQGAWLVYPNYHGAAPGQRAQFYHYDPDVKDWYVYGTGRISADGRQGIPDPKTRFYAFTGAMFSSGGQPAASGQTPGGPTRTDPVDPSTGVFVMHKTDLSLPDVIPVALTRTYNSGDDLARPLGRGMTHPYAMFLWSALEWQEVDLILPEGGKIHYVRTSAGSSWTDAVLVHQATATTSATPTPFYKSVITWNGDGWDLTLKDGTVYVFGENAPLQAIRDRYGNTVTVTHASGQYGNVTQVTSPNGRWIAFTYDGSNRITQATDNIGRTVTYAYDGNGNLSTVTDPLSQVTTYTYTAANQLATIKDGRNIVYLTNTYTNGRVTQQTLADGVAAYQLAYTVDGAGNITQTDVTNPRGHTERLTFNANHYVISDIQAYGTPLARTTTTTRLGANFVSAIVDGLNRRTEYTYDDAGHVLTTTTLAGTADAATTTYTYEPLFNQLASITDPLNHRWIHDYDANGLFASVTDPLSHQTTIALNREGQVLSVTDPLMHQWQFGYSGGDQTSVTNPLGAVWRQFVDAAGRVKSTTDPLGRVTQINVDARNHPIAVTDSLGGQNTFAYDANGNLLSLTDALMNATTYTYDDSDRLATRTDPIQKSASYAYDQDGNRTQVIDRKGQVTTYEYDELDRLTQASFQNGSTVLYTYDAGDRVTQIVDSENGSITRSYDNMNRLTREVTPEGVVDYTYDADGRRITMTVSNQGTVIYSYDSAHRMTALAQDSTAVAITYDDANRRSTITYPNGIVATHVYDAANHLVALTYMSGASALADFSYSYDVTGRRVSAAGNGTKTGLPQPVASATYDAASHLLAWNGQTSTYDLNGNLTSDGTTTYSWNARNQLSGLSGGANAIFFYDSVGRRRAKMIGGSTTRFLYDGINSIQELSSSGAPTANLLTGFGIDETLTRTDAGGTSTLLIDALGSTHALADASGVVQTTYIYEPFGATSSSGTESQNATQYAGREADGNGLYFYRLRFFDSMRGRFISEDPVSAQADRFAVGNPYAYALDNPTNLIDPIGAMACTPRCQTIFFDCLTDWVLPGASTILQQVIEGGSMSAALLEFNQALEHAAGQGLTYPFKSSVIREFLSHSRAFTWLSEVVGPVLSTAGVLNCLNEEYQAYKSGQCIP